MQEQKQILNATISIEEVVDKGKKLSIKGNDGNRVSTYSVWKAKQDGSDSLTYAQWKTMGLSVGQSVYVGYVIDEYSTEIGGQLKKIQSKKIINFREPVGQASQPPSQGKSFNVGHSGASRGPSNDAFDLFPEKRTKMNQRKAGLWERSGCSAVCVPGTVPKSPMFFERETYLKLTLVHETFTTLSTSATYVALAARSSSLLK